jgi:hypothetical protein
VVVHIEPRVVHVLLLPVLLLLLLPSPLLCAVLLPVLPPKLISTAQGDASRGMCAPAPHQAPLPPTTPLLCRVAI